MTTEGRDRFAVFERISLAQTLLVAILLATQFLPQPTVISSGIISQSGTSYPVPAINFLVLIVSLAIGCWLALAGALRAHWTVAFPVIALVTTVLGSVPQLILLQSQNASLGKPLTTATWSSVAQLGILAVFWVWPLSNAIRHRRRRSLAEGQLFTRHARDLKAVLVLLLVFAGLELIGGLTLVRAGRNPYHGSFVTGGIGAEVIMLPSLLVLPVFAFSTDLLHRGQKLVRLCLLTSHGDVRFPRWLPGVTALVALGMILLALRESNQGFAPSLMLSLLFMGAVGLHLRHLRGFRWVHDGVPWPIEVSPVWYFVGAVALFFSIGDGIGTVIPPTVFLVLPSGAPYVTWNLAPMLQVPLAIVFFTAASLLIVRGRAGRPRVAIGGAFLALVSLLILLNGIPLALSYAGIPVLQPEGRLRAMILCAATGTLIWMACLALQRRWSEARRPLSAALLMLLGLQLVAWGSDLLELSQRPGWYVLLAAVLLLLPLWDGLAPVLRRKLALTWPGRVSGGERKLSGDASTHDGDERSLLAPQVRRLLQAAYLMTSNALLLYLGSLQAPFRGGLAPATWQRDPFTPAGLLFLGVPLVAVGFIEHVAYTRRRSSSSSSSSAGRVSPLATRRLIVGGGAIGFVAVTAVLLVTALPQLPRLLYQPYSAAVPGPDCDPGAATWSLNRPEGGVSTACGVAGGFGMRVAAGKGGAVWFVPPSGVFSQNYRASVRVNLDDLASGCAGIMTRDTLAPVHVQPLTFVGGAFDNFLCVQRGSPWVVWRMSRLYEHTSTQLAVGTVPRAGSYLLEVVTAGAVQRLVVNGVSVGSVSDMVLAGTRHVDLSVGNNDGTAGSVVFSNFMYRPTSSSVTSARAYRAVSPGPGCDRDATQWTLMTTGLEMRCSLGETEVIRRTSVEEVLGFTPPNGVFPPNYRLSVRMDLSGLKGGCASIEERASAAEADASVFCGNRAWRMDVVANGRRVWWPLGGSTPAAGAYTLEVTAYGSYVSFAINGVQLGVTMRTVHTTRYIDLDIFGAPGTCSFGNFAFTPLS